ncbi:hypothetical protein [Streptomyces hirsutus]|uniref:hypothetical protein n=1 Tax=Streptomyces hirsutus TaxID=35620 RepID=UPI000A7A699C|nr:hypothetical protein [Streptomyces hirsutus]
MILSRSRQVLKAWLDAQAPQFHEAAAPNTGSWIGRHRDPGDRGRAVVNGDRRIHQHPTRIMAGSRLAQTRHRLSEPGGQRGPIRDTSTNSQDPT